jgi:SAM-dependent methyltransferase
MPPPTIPVPAHSLSEHTREIEVEMVIPVKWLIDQYKITFGIDIRHLVPDGTEEIKLLRRKDTGYRFWNPSNIVGDSSFYEQLQKNDWYYFPDKWEFERALTYLPREPFSLLEVGAAKGDFLKKVQAAAPHSHLTGLELNKSAAEQANAAGLKVLTQTTADMRSSSDLLFDVVASFQVLEHLPDPYEVLIDLVSMLKPYGRLIIGVPDNSTRPTASLFVQPGSLLNMPPHHQGLWDIRSLSHLIRIFPLRMISLEVEPSTARHHRLGYRGLLKSGLLERHGSILGLGLYALSRPIFDYALGRLGEYLPAHSVLAVFEKEQPTLAAAQ